MSDGYAKRRSYQWEHTRTIVYMIAAVNRDPKKNFPSIQQFMPLPTDHEIDEKSESKRMQAKLDEYKKNKKEQRQKFADASKLMKK